MDSHLAHNELISDSLSAADGLLLFASEVRFCQRLIHDQLASLRRFSPICTAYSAVSLCKWQNLHRLLAPINKPPFPSVTASRTDHTAAAARDTKGKQTLRAICAFPVEPRQPFLPLVSSELNIAPGVCTIWKQKNKKTKTNEKPCFSKRTKLKILADLFFSNPLDKGGENGLF